jgi:hypothetical protein
MLANCTFPVGVWNGFIKETLFSLAMLVGAEDDVLQTDFIMIFDVRSGWVEYYVF